MPALLTTSSPRPFLPSLHTFELKLWGQGEGEVSCPHGASGLRGVTHSMLSTTTQCTSPGEKAEDKRREQFADGSQGGADWFSAQVCTQESLRLAFSHGPTTLTFTPPRPLLCLHS